MNSVAVYRCLSPQELAHKWAKLDLLVCFRGVYDKVMEDGPFLGLIDLTTDERRAFENLYLYCTDPNLAGRPRPPVLGNTPTTDPLRGMPDVPEIWVEPTPEQIFLAFPFGVDRGAVGSISYLAWYEDGTLHYKPLVQEPLIQERPAKPRSMLDTVNLVLDYLRSVQFATTCGPLTRFEMDTLLLLRRVAIHHAHATPGYAQMRWSDFVLKWGTFDVGTAIAEVIGLYAISTPIRDALALSADEESLLHGLCDWFKDPARSDPRIMLAGEAQMRCAPDAHTGWVEEWRAPDRWKKLYLQQDASIVTAVRPVVYTCHCSVRKDGAVVVEYTPSVAATPAYDQAVNNPNVVYDYFRTDMIATQRGALTDAELRLLARVKRVLMFHTKILPML